MRRFPSLGMSQLQGKAISAGLRLEAHGPTMVTMLGQGALQSKVGPGDNCPYYKDYKHFVWDNGRCALSIFIECLHLFIEVT